VTIPATALQRGPSGPFAYVVKPDSTVEVRNIQTDGENGNLAVVRSGIQDGERVVTSNQYKLQPGSHVKVSPNVGAVAQASEFASVTP
jgi:multidrug efflux system membrane fusion protein